MLVKSYSDAHSIRAKFTILNNLMKMYCRDNKTAMATTATATATTTTGIRPINLMHFDKLASFVRMFSLFVLFFFLLFWCIPKYMRPCVRRNNFNKIAHTKSNRTHQLTNCYWPILINLNKSRAKQLNDETRSFDSDAFSVWDVRRSHLGLHRPTHAASAHTHKIDIASLLLSMRNDNMRLRPFRWQFGDIVSTHVESKKF